MRGDISGGIYQKIAEGERDDQERSGGWPFSELPAFGNSLLARAECPGGMPTLFN